MLFTSTLFSYSTFIKSDLTSTSGVTLEILLKAITSKFPRQCPRKTRSHGKTFYCTLNLKSVATAFY